MPKLRDLIPDENNANKGTPRGQKMIVASLQEDGFGRAGLLDKNGRIIAGNKTTEASAEVFGVDVEPIIVPNDGTRPVFVQRTDLDLEHDVAARRLAYRDNLASHFGFEIDPAVVIADVEAGFDFTMIDVDVSELVGDIEDANNYARSVDPPIYSPTGPKPDISQLYDTTRTDQLIAAIDSSDVPESDKQFLRAAAHRHTVFNFKAIAEYYAHSGQDVQALMEESALVIIDFGKAIELGFVKLTQDIAEIVRDEYG